MKKIYLLICVLFLSIVHSQNNSDLEAKRRADAEALQMKLAADARAKADSEAFQAKLAAEMKAKADIEANRKFILIQNLKTNISNLASHTLLGNATIIKVKDENNLGENDVNCDKPKTLNDLDSGYDVFFSSTKYSLDVNGKIVFLSVDKSTSKTNLNYKFLQYKKQKCLVGGKEEEVIYGCGVDLSLDVKSKKNSANISSLPNIAAAVTYKDADVQYKLKVIGITGDAIRSNLNINGDFDVDNYGKIISKIDEILKNMGSTGVNISPQLIVLEK